MAKITVYLPKSEAPKMEKISVIAPDMEVNFPSDYKIESTALLVSSKKAPSHVTVSLSISPPKTQGHSCLNLAFPTSRRMSDASFARSLFPTAPSVGTSPSRAS